MYHNILIPTDGSELSEKAVEHGVALAKTLGASVTFVTVHRPFHAMSEEPEMVVAMPEEFKSYVHDYLTGESTERLASAKEVAERSNVSCDCITIEHDHVHQGILDAADQKNCDLIVMASHGRSGISAVVLGSETVKVLTHCNLPVLVYR